MRFDCQAPVIKVKLMMCFDLLRRICREVFDTIDLHKMLIMTNITG